MRTIQTFVLRLLVDTEDPRALRGAVRCVSDDEEQTFADAQSLLALLRGMCQATDTDDVEQFPPPRPGKEMMSRQMTNDQ